MLFVLQVIEKLPLHKVFMLEFRAATNYITVMTLRPYLQALMHVFDALIPKTAPKNTKFKIFMLVPLFAFFVIFSIFVILYIDFLHDLRSTKGQISQADFNFLLVGTGFVNLYIVPPRAIQRG